MLALFGVRFLCLGTRVILNSGPQTACLHYFAMEVRPLMSTGSAPSDVIYVAGPSMVLAHDIAAQTDHFDLIHLELKGM